jgi:hypothetical protein
MAAAIDNEPPGAGARMNRLMRGLEYRATPVGIVTEDPLHHFNLAKFRPTTPANRAPRFFQHAGLRTRRDGLFIDEPGNYAHPPMAACTGREIIDEILGHPRVGSEREKILDTSQCIPCLMPFITSQFLPREKGDRRQYVQRPDDRPSGFTEPARRRLQSGQRADRPGPRWRAAADRHGSW